MLQQFAPVSGAKLVDGFILDLADPFPGEAELIADVFEGHGVFDADAEIEFDHITLAVGQGSQRPFDFTAQRFEVFERGVGTGGAGVFQHIEQGVIFAFDEGRVHGYVTGGYAEGGFHLFCGNFQQLGQFFGRRLAFVFLFEFGECFVDLIEGADLVQREADGFVRPGPAGSTGGSTKLRRR